MTGFITKWYVRSDRSVDLEGLDQQRLDLVRPDGLAQVAAQNASSVNSDAYALKSRIEVTLVLHEQQPDRFLVLDHLHAVGECVKLWAGLDPSVIGP